MTTSFRTFLTIISLFLAATNTYAQVDNTTIRQQVLKKGITDSVFLFGKWTESGKTETYLEYLGQFKTIHGQTFRIVNSTWIWGLSKRATSQILVFNDKNQYVGSYFVGMVGDLPTSMQNGKLIFKNTDPDCDRNLITVIDLKKGLPKRFFRKCKGEDGDLYYFGSE